MTLPSKSPPQSRFHAFDLLATPIAVLNSNGAVLFVNAELEDVMGQSRRSLEGDSFLQFLPTHSH